MKRNSLLGRAHVAKSIYYLRHVRPSVDMYISAAATENIFVTFDTEDFIKIIQFCLKSGKKKKNISPTLHENRATIAQSV